MPMDAAAVDKLIEKANFQPEVAIAVAEAVEVTIRAENIVTIPVLDARFAAAEARIEAKMEAEIKAENFVTVPVLDARFAAAEAKMEAKMESRFSEADRRMDARFASLEKSILSAKVWAVILYAGLAIVFFSSLAADHRYLSGRLDEFMVRSDQRFEETEKRSDQRFQQVEARLDSLDAKMEQMSEQMRTLLARSDGAQSAIPTSRPSRSRSH